MAKLEQFLLIKKNVYYVILLIVLDVIFRILVRNAKLLIIQCICLTLMEIVA